MLNLYGFIYIPYSLLQIIMRVQKFTANNLHTTFLVEFVFKLVESVTRSVI